MPRSRPPTPVREPPRTPRGARTRAALVTAARTVFERDGYLNTRLTDITAEANVATGSFYTYFASKEEIFAAVLAEVQEEMLHPHVRELRRRRGEAFAERNARTIRDLQARGLADPDVDPLLAASALSAMVGRMAYSTYVIGDDWGLDELVATLTRLWANALRL